MTFDPYAGFVDSDIKFSELIDLSGLLFLETANDNNEINEYYEQLSFFDRLEIAA